jgi:hypothetical protein
MGRASRHHQRSSHEGVITYLRMFDANADGADWREVLRIVLHIDAERAGSGVRTIVISRAPSG